MPQSEWNTVDFEVPKIMPSGLVPFKTVAIWLRAKRLYKDDKLFIPELIGLLKYWDETFTNGILTVKDSGGGLGPTEKSNYEALDLYLGDQLAGGAEAFQDLMECRGGSPASPWWDRPPSEPGRGDGGLGECTARPPMEKEVDVYRSRR